MLLHNIIALQQTFFFFFFNDTATTEIYTLSLHDALPICWHFVQKGELLVASRYPVREVTLLSGPRIGDRKSTRLNSSHLVISYAVFCLKKKKIRMLYSAIIVQHLMFVIYHTCLHLPHALI